MKQYMFSMALALLSTGCLSCISAMPTSTVSKREALGNNCNPSARALREGLEILTRVAIPANLPRVFARDHLHFSNKMTALEFICASLDNVQRIEQQQQTGNSTNNIQPQSTTNLLQERTCSWLNSLSDNTLPDCAPSEVEFFCRRVQILNVSFRTGTSLGSFNNLSFTRWVLALVTQETTPSHTHEHICQLIFRRSCAYLS